MHEREIFIVYVQKRKSNLDGMKLIVYCCLLMYFYIKKAVLSLVLVCFNMKEWRDISFGIPEDSRVAAWCIHEFPFYGLE